MWERVDRANYRSKHIYGVESAPCTCKSCRKDLADKLKEYRQIKAAYKRLLDSQKAGRKMLRRERRRIAREAANNDDKR